MKRQNMEWKNMFANHISNKGLAFRNIKKFKT